MSADNLKQFLGSKEAPWLLTVVVGAFAFCVNYVAKEIVDNPVLCYEKLESKAKKGAAAADNLVEYEVTNVSTKHRLTNLKFVIRALGDGAAIEPNSAKSRSRAPHVLYRGGDVAEDVVSGNTGSFFIAEMHPNSRIVLSVNLNAPSATRLEFATDEHLPLGESNISPVQLRKPSLLTYFATNHVTVMAILAVLYAGGLGGYITYLLARSP